MITIQLTNVYCQIDGLTDMDVITKLDRKLSYYIPGYQFMRMYKLHQWDGKKHLLDRKLKFQTGLLPYVEQILKASDTEYTIQDNRIQPTLGDKLPLAPEYYTPRDYQIAAVDACLKHKCGIVKMATGGGKTLTISMLIAATNIKTVVYVISLDLLYQTKSDIEKALGIECGIVGDGQCDIKQITVSTPWTVIHAYDKEYDPFDDDEGTIKEADLDQSSKFKIQKMVEETEMFIYDEAQFLAASSLQVISKASKNAYYRFGFSGTPWRDTSDDILLEAATGPDIVDINATTLIEQGILVPPRIYFIEVPELDGYSEETNHPYPKVYEAYIAENKTRNELIVKALTKLQASKRKILVLARRKKHGLNLLNMLKKSPIKVYYLNGDAPIEERQAVKDLFNADELDVIIATTIFDQGIDLPKIDALILAGSGKSSTKALQRIGRAIRGFPGKTDAIIIDFIDNAPFLYSQSQKRWRIYKTESAFSIKLPEGIDW